MDWESGHHVPLGYHRLLLEDHVRMDAYERAIRELVKPGDVVLDVGTGSGILAMLAARAGASRVHAVESADVVGLAEQNVRANGLENIIVVHHGDARELTPMEPVDVLVSECMGRFLIDDGMIPAIVAAGKRLKPGGVCYLSFKLGKGGRQEGERFFLDMDEERLVAAMSDVPGVEVLRTWRTVDHRPDRGDLTWVNQISRLG